MDESVLTPDGTDLRIGDFSVRCSARTKLNGKVFQLPISFMAFQQKTGTSSDFQFVVDEDFSSDGGEEFFRADNYMNHGMSRRRDGGIDWNAYASDDSTAIQMHILNDWHDLILSRNVLPEVYLKREISFAFNYMALLHGACVFHGVIMEYEGKGILVMAHSGVGKTTHTRMWRDQENALILNGDRCLCRKLDGIWYAYGMPWCGTSGEYINRRVPVSCVVMLDRGETNFVRRIDPYAASMYLMERIIAPLWESRMRENAINDCIEFSELFPVLHLYCTPEKESVQVLKEAILSL